MQGIIGCLCLALIGCREIQPFETISATQGYQIKGKVTNASGVPLDSVRVRLYFNLNLVGTTPIDAQAVIVTEPVSIVQITVYTPDYVFVRQIFSDHLTRGPVPRARWDGNDQKGAPVASGKYLIRYVIDTTIVKDSPVLVDGHLMGVTDALGRFTITPDRLPVAEMFDRYFSDNTYNGTFQVQPTVGLDFRKSFFHQAYSLELQKDKITSAVFILE